MIGIIGVCLMLLLLAFLLIVFAFGGMYLWSLWFPLYPAWFGSFLVITIFCVGFYISMLLMFKDSVTEDPFPTKHEKD